MTETCPLCTGHPWKTVLRAKSSSKINAFSWSGCKAICSVLTICLSHTFIICPECLTYCIDIHTFELHAVLTRKHPTPIHWWSNCTTQNAKQTPVSRYWQFGPLTSCDVAMSAHTCTLPAFSVWDWLLLLLAGDEGGPPHRTAVAGSEPAHRRRGGKRSGAEPVIWLSVCGQRRRRTPHCHKRKRLVNTPVSLPFINVHKQTKVKCQSHISSSLRRSRWWLTKFGIHASMPCPMKSYTLVRSPFFLKGHGPFSSRLCASGEVQPAVISPEREDETSLKDIAEPPETLHGFKCRISML